MPPLFCCGKPALSLPPRRGALPEKWECTRAGPSKFIALTAPPSGAFRQKSRFAMRAVIFPAVASFHRSTGELKKEPRGEKIHIGAGVLSGKCAQGGAGRRSEVRIGETMHTALSENTFSPPFIMTDPKPGIGRKA